MIVYNRLPGQKVEITDLRLWQFRPRDYDRQVRYR